MKIRYTFANGDTSEVEVSEDLGMEIVAYERVEANGNRRALRHNASIEELTEKGVQFKSQDTDPLGSLLSKFDHENLIRAFHSLTPDEQRLFHMRFVEGLPLEEIARREHRGINAIWKRVRKLKATLCKLLE